jgi:hypothetical protein
VTSNASCSIRSRVSGLCAARDTTSFSFCAISGGVAAGTNSPTQV